MSRRRARPSIYWLLRREKSRSSWQLFCSVCVTVRILEDDDEQPRKGRFSWVRNEHFFRPKNVKTATFAICSAPVRCYECSLAARERGRLLDFGIYVKTSIK